MHGVRDPAFGELDQAATVKAQCQRQPLDSAMNGALNLIDSELRELRRQGADQVFEALGVRFGGNSKWRCAHDSQRNILTQSL